LRGTVHGNQAIIHPGRAAVGEDVEVGIPSGIVDGIEASESDRWPDAGDKTPEGELSKGVVEWGGVDFMHKGLALVVGLKSDIKMGGDFGKSSAGCLAEDEGSGCRGGEEAVDAGKHFLTPGAGVAAKGTESAHEVQECDSIGLCEVTALGVGVL